MKTSGILAGITIGNLLEGNQPTANLILTGQSEGTLIKALELYINDKKVETYEYDNLEMKREEIYKLENLEFYEDKECYVKVITANKEENSAPKTVRNDKLIKTAIDLKNLATQVNEKNNTFNGKTIELIDDITTEANWQPIGYWDGVTIGVWNGKSFEGTFEGNNHSVTIVSLSKEKKYKSSGLFGMGIGCTINNLTVNGTLDAESTRIGGIIGIIKNGTITNCTNHGEITDTKNDFHGGITGGAENSQIINCTNTAIIYGNSEIGGICGWAYFSSEISNCTNSGFIKCYGVSEAINGNLKGEEGIVGGICGQISNSTSIEKSTNTGEITANVDTILPKGILGGGIVGQARDYAIVSTSKNKGKVHFDISSGSIKNLGSLGGVVGHLVNSTIDQCFNIATISAKYNNNYGMNLIGGVARIHEFIDYKK